MSFFSAANITAGYGKKNVIEDVSFTMERGCLQGILGANGSGKTTLLKTICSTLPHNGTCDLNGTRLEKLTPRQIARLCSYIPQRSGVSIDISAADVVLMGFNPQLGMLEHPTASMKEKAYQALAQTGLAGKEESNYLTLSEGQKQLCILARTLCTEAQLLLLDEPESALDFRFRYRMLKILRHWLTQSHGAAIVTLHDPSLALNYCDQLLLLSEGKVLGTIRPGTDSLKQMEKLLEKIYGRINLTRCVSRDGQTHLVLLKEEENIEWNL